MFVCKDYCFSRDLQSTILGTLIFTVFDFQGIEKYRILLSIYTCLYTPYNRQEFQGPKIQESLHKLYGYCLCKENPPPKK